MKRKIFSLKFTYFIISFFMSGILIGQGPVPSQMIKNYGNIFSGNSNVAGQSANIKKSSCTTSSRIKFREFDGSCNNQSNASFGMSGIPLLRAIPSPGNGLPTTTRDCARTISNIACDQGTLDIPSSRRLSGMVYTFLQFIDHNITATAGGGAPEPICVPSGDSHFPMPISFSRSQNTIVSGIPQQQNDLTSWLDGAAIYGDNSKTSPSCPTKATWLRTLTHGKLKVWVGPNGTMLPCNTNNGDCNAAFDPCAPDMGQHGMTKVFVAGDHRANEQPGLLSMHTLFVLEHNRVCDLLIANYGLNGTTDDEEIYQRARKVVVGKLQAITYNEVLPALGISLSPYAGYNADVQPDITNLFATAAFRLGHTMVPGRLLLVDGAEQFVTTPGSISTNLSGTMPSNLLGFLEVKDAFFNPSIVENLGITPILKGLSVQTQQKVDLKVVGALRNLLFGPPGSGFDLIALNIQRGRDHGLPDYNTVRAHYGTAATTWSDISSDPVIQTALQTAYNNDINNIDAFIGLLAEDHLPSSSVGLTIHTILKEQFEKIRDGDRFWYQIDPRLSLGMRDQIHATTLDDLIRANTNLTCTQENVFFSKPIAPNYCAPDYTNASPSNCYAFFRQVKINNTTHNSSTSGVDNGTNYSDHSNKKFSIDIHSTHTLNYRIGRCSGSGSVDAVANAWIDWNQDGIFDDITERLDPETAVNFTGSTHQRTISFTVPPHAKRGDTKMRIRIDHDDTDSYSGCTDNSEANAGETEDYTIAISPYCLPTHSSNNCAMRISNVSLLTIANSTGTSTANGYYSDFTSQSATMKRGEACALSILVEGCDFPITGKASVWIDWNQNDLFDAGELLHTGNGFVAGGPYGSASTTINVPFTVPVDAIEGNTRMRIRFGSIGTPNPCNNYSSGETEDYGIKVEACTLNIGSITGSELVMVNSAETYSVPALTVPGVTYNWSVDNAIIASGQNTSAIACNWTNQGGIVSVEPVKAGCISNVSTLAVGIDDPGFLSLTLEKKESIPGNLVTFGVVVKNFNSIKGLQFGLQWDNSILHLQDWNHDASLNSGLLTIGSSDGSGTVTNPPAAPVDPLHSQIDFLWFGFSPINIVDGDLIVTLTFEVIGNVGDKSPINVVPTNSVQPTVSFSDNLNNPVQSVINNGYVKVMHAMGSMTTVTDPSGLPLIGCSIDVDPMAEGPDMGTENLIDSLNPSDTLTIDNNGLSFINLIEGKSYEIKPFFESELKIDPDINIGDVIQLIDDGIFNANVATVPQVISMDMNKDAIVEVTDLVILLGQTVTDHNTDYRFVSHQWLPSLNDPHNFSQKDTIEEMGAFRVHSFTGIKVGDVTGAANIELPSMRGGNLLKLSVPEAEVAPEQYINIPISVDHFDNIAGFQFGLDWDHTVLEYIDILSPSLKNKFTIDGFQMTGNAVENSFLEELGLIVGDTHTDEGELIIAGYNMNPEGWYLDSASTMAVVRFKVIGQRGESTDINISNHLTGTHFIGNERNSIGFSFKKGTISIPLASSNDDLIIKEDGIKVYPNPVESIATIEVDVPTDAAISVHVYNGVGQEVYQANKKGTVGINRFSIDGKAFAAGVYYCHIQVNEKTFIRKLVFIK